MGYFSTLDLTQTFEQTFRPNPFAYSTATFPSFNLVDLSRAFEHKNWNKSFSIFWK